MTETKAKEFEPMLGSALDPKHPIRWPIFASTKLDGIRLSMDGMAPKTRTKKTVPNRHINKLLEDPVFMDLDLELILGDPADPLCYNKTYSAVMSHAGEPDIQFYIFDIVVPGAPFEARYRHLLDIAHKLPPNARIVEQVLLHTQAELDMMYGEVTAAGHEGLILKQPLGLYKFGRSTAKEQLLLKLKPQEDSEFAILGCYEAMENTNEAFTNELGRTDRSTHAEGLVPKGMLGGFHAKDIHTGVEFNVAPGKLTHDERATLWAQWLTEPEVVKAKIGKYRHFPIGAKDKPRHGRWIGWWDGKK